MCGLPGQERTPSTEMRYFLRTLGRPALADEGLHPFAGIELDLGDAERRRNAGDERSVFPHRQAPHFQFDGFSLSWITHHAWFWWSSTGQRIQTIVSAGTCGFFQPPATFCELMIKWQSRQVCADDRNTHAIVRDRDGLSRGQRLAKRTQLQSGQLMEPLCQIGEHQIAAGRRDQSDAAGQAVRPHGSWYGTRCLVKQVDKVGVVTQPAI